MTDGRKRAARVFCNPVHHRSWRLGARRRPHLRERRTSAMSSSGWTALPPGRAGLGALQRRSAPDEAGADPPRRAARPTCDASRPRSSGAAQVAEPSSRQYQGQALSSTSQVLLSRQPRCLPPAAHHGLGVQRPADPDDGRLRRPGEAPRACARPPPSASSTGSPPPSRSSAQDKARSTPRPPRPSALLGQLKDRGGRERAVPADPSQRHRPAPPAVSQRPASGRAAARPCATRWPRSATPTSTAPPARTPSTARV